MTRTILSIAAAACVLGACARRHVESGMVLPPRTTARLDAIGARPTVSIHNASAMELPVAVGWGEVAMAHDFLEPGVTRWWSPGGPRSFWITNDADRPAAVTYTVVGADVRFTVPADKP